MKILLPFFCSIIVFFLFSRDRQTASFQTNIDGKTIVFPINVKDAVALYNLKKTGNHYFDTDRLGNESFVIFYDTKVDLLVESNNVDSLILHKKVYGVTFFIRNKNILDETLKSLEKKYGKNFTFYEYTGHDGDLTFDSLPLGVYAEEKKIGFYKMQLRPDIALIVDGKFPWADGIPHGVRISICAGLSKDEGFRFAAYNGNILGD